MNLKRWHKILLFLILLFSVPYLIILFIIFIFEIFGFTEPQYNPRERNHIIFKDASVNQIIDSLDRFELITRTYKFPRDKDEPSEIYMGYWRDSFSINEYSFYKPTFDSLRKSTAFAKLSDNQITEFLTLYKFLFNNGITPGSLGFYGQNIYTYKDFRIYDKNNSRGRYDDDLERFLIKRDSNYKYVFNFDGLYKIIDSNNRMYLCAFKNARIYGDSVPYTFKKWK